MSADRLQHIYDRIILGHPRSVISILLVVVVALGCEIRNFRLDASADSLILEHDADLARHRRITERYGTSDYLFLTYSPTNGSELFSAQTLANLRQLRDDLAALPRVSSVVTILDVPLLQNPPVPMKDLKRNIKTLESADVDVQLAKEELADSAIFKNLLVSADLKTTALQINLEGDADFDELRDRRSELHRLYDAGKLSPQHVDELQAIDTRYDARKEALKDQRHTDIAAVRAVAEQHRAGATIFLGGVPMIADDMISFIRSDLQIFGAAIFLFLIVVLGLIFRRKRWVVLPIVCCACSAVAAMGLVSVAGWRVTVISSNFVSLQLVLTMSITIHLIVRYNELLAQSPSKTHRQLVLETATSMFRPCWFAVLTTVAGFTSLLICDVLPVINFGWMMTLGLVVSLVITFLLFPTLLVVLDRPPLAALSGGGRALTGWCARITAGYRPAIFMTSAALIVVTILGVLRLDVENSFIDYFRKSTEIYQGMHVIDSHLGGTTPLDVVIDFPDTTVESVAKPEIQPDDEVDADFGDFEDDFGDFGDDVAQGNRGDADTYWYTEHKLDTIGRVHRYLEALPATGKVLSLHTIRSVTTAVNDGQPLDGLGLAILFKELPERFQDIIIRPYVSIPDNQARISIRIKDSMKSLRRDALLRQIRTEIAGAADLAPEQVHVAGMMVLYNNMLQSLFRSQVKTIGFTVAILLVMFLILFRSIRISLIAIFPNILSSLSVLGVMGLCHIPLDMMTITIVAISVGIAVDDTIHYIHRFKREFSECGSYLESMRRCHGSIGNAMYYTSVTIGAGFSILVLSNFIPSMLFGLLTGLAMVMALVGALTLLPALIIVVKPFGNESPTLD